MERGQLLGEYKQVENPSIMSKRTTQKADRRLCIDVRYATKRIPEDAEGGYQLDGAIDALPITASSGSLPVEQGEATEQTGYCLERVDE